jgi:radical SAM superfamily enzyme YgiQ (UPF0313 family)
MTYNFILFCDNPSFAARSRSFGPYRMASELRKQGYTVLVVSYSATINWQRYTEILDIAIGEDTYAVGVSTNAMLARKHTILKQAGEEYDHTMGYDHTKHPWYFESLSYNFSRNSTEPYVNYVKQKNPKIKFLVGGFTAYDYIDDPYVDNVFIGFSENKLVEYMNSISKRGPKRIFNKVVDYDRTARDGEFDFKTSVTEYVETDNIHKDEFLLFEFGRGCIFNCAFCSYPILGQQTKNHLKTQETIYKELMTNYEKWGITSYSIIDETFNDSTDKLLAIREVIQSLPFKPNFWAFLRIDLIGRFPEQADILKDIGIKDSYWGIDAWNDKTAALIGKGGKITKKLNILRWLKDEKWGEDITIASSVIIGLPYDMKRSARESAEWYVKEGHRYINDFSYSPLVLKPNDNTTPYQWLSGIEKDFSKYGYTVYNDWNEEYPVYWEKDDDGDITNFIQANNLAIELNELIEPYIPRKSTGLKLKMFIEAVPNPYRNFKDMIYDFTEMYYWPRFFLQIKNAQ